LSPRLSVFKGRKENDTMKKIAKIILVTAVTLLIVGVYFYEQRTVQTLANFPFEVKYRKSLTGNGYVDQIFNNSGGSQPVKITLNNPTLNQTKVYSAVIDAHQFREIGRLQGWTASSGDIITLEWNGVFKEFKIP
jgi:hypothetical protein